MKEQMFSIELSPENWPHDDLSDVQIVFHGVNKSGSLAMTKVLRAAYLSSGRADEFLCHYGSGMSYEAFADRVTETKGRSFVVGHRLYGAIPPRPRRIMITQFRYPLPRILSVYQWLKNKHVAEHNTSSGFPNLDDFVRQFGGLGHSQIIQFGVGYGALAQERKKRLSVRDVYESAIEAIEREVYCIGIAEYFEESIFLFARLCGVDAVPAWQRDNRNAGRPLVDDVDSGSLDLIREIYRYDFALYDWALKRFRDQLSRVRFGASLESYKLACEDQYKDRIIISAIS